MLHCGDAYAQLILTHTDYWSYLPIHIELIRVVVMSMQTDPFHRGGIIGQTHRSLVTLVLFESLKSTVVN